LTLSNLQPADFTNYTALVHNSCGAAESSPALLTLAPSLIIASSGFDGTNFTLTFPTEVGLAYHVEYKSNLDDLIWQPLTNMDGTGSSVTVADPDLASVSKFYRIRRQ